MGRKLFGLEKSNKAVLLKSAIPLAVKVIRFREFYQVYKNLTSLRSTMGDGDTLRFKFVCGSTSRYYATSGIMTWARELRGCIVPRGKQFVNFDYDAQELRIIALITGNIVLRRMLEQGEGVHECTAGIVGCDRVQGKTVNYAYIYGMDDNALINQFGLTKGGLRRINKYLPMQDLRDYAEKHAKQVDGENVIHTFIDGTPLRFEEIKEAANYQVQGSGADILRRALSKFNSMDIDLAMVHHDAFLLDDPDDDLIEEVREALTFEHKGLTFPVTITKGQTWAEVT